MARVSTYRSRGKMPIGVPDVSVSPHIGALTAGQRAKSRFAEVVGLISAAEGRRIQLADQKAQNIAGEAAIKSRMLELFDSFDTNPNEDDYQPAYEKTVKSLDEIVKNTTNANSKRDLQQFIQTNKPSWDASLNDAVLSRKRTNTLARRDLSVSEIDDMDLSDPLELDEAELRVGKGGDLMRELGYSQEQIEGWMDVALKKIENQSIYQQAENISAEQGYNAAIKWLMAKKLNVEDRNKIASKLASTERLRATQHQIDTDQTNRTMLADLWDGKLTDPQVVTGALRAGYLDKTDAKYLREAMLKKEPPELDLKKLAAVKEAIIGIGTGANTYQEALSVLYANLDGIDPTTGKSQLEKIYGEHDKTNAESENEAKAIMEELIRDRDPFSGFFTDDERQILGSAEALLMLSSEIEKAAKEGKPLERRDILIKAIQIGRQIKRKIKDEEEQKTLPTFQPYPTEGYPLAPREREFTKEGKPIIKGAAREPKFIMKGDEPEKVFDEKGRELGLRRKDGSVFRVGYHALIGGNKYEYMGNGNWKLLSTQKQVEVRPITKTKPERKKEEQKQIPKEPTKKQKKIPPYSKQLADLLISQFGGKDKVPEHLQPLLIPDAAWKKREEEAKKRKDKNK